MPALKAVFITAAFFSAMPALAAPVSIPFPIPPIGIPSTPTTSQPELKGIFVIHPAGDFQLCLGVGTRQIRDHRGGTEVDTSIGFVNMAPCTDTSQTQPPFNQFIIQDLHTGQPWDGITDTTVSIQDRAGLTCMTNDDTYPQNVATDDKQVYYDSCGHPTGGRGESQRQVWNIKTAPGAFAEVSTDIGSVQLGAQRECWQDSANQEIVRTPCTGTYDWLFQPVLH